MSSNPIDDPELWHYVTISGIDTPGVATVSPIKRERKYDTKEGPGRSGETQTFRGNRGVKGVSVKCKLFEPEDYDAWESLHAKLAVIADKGEAVDFWHPSAETIGLRSVIVTSITAPVALKEGDALFEGTIEVEEFRPVPKTNATKTPSGSKGGSGASGGQQNALTAREQEAQRLIEEARRIG